MIKKTIIVFLCIIPFFANSQKLVPILVQGEVGMSIGKSTYFGDLNEKANMQHTYLAYNFFYKKNLGNYVAARISLGFCKIGYSDEYNAYNQYKYLRNLSFESNITELSLQGDFNFFAFIPGLKTYTFTPYLTFGVGMITYSPYTTLNGTKYFLRKYHTEGQNSDLYPERKEYKKMTLTLPVGFGLKWALSKRISVGVEVLYRFANTDYLDDISTTYPDKAVFDNLSTAEKNIALQLYDRSPERGYTIGIADKQRGNSKQKDQFATASFFVSINLQDYECPKVNAVKGW